MTNQPRQYVTRPDTVRAVRLDSSRETALAAAAWTRGQAVEFVNGWGVAYPLTKAALPGQWIVYSRDARISILDDTTFQARYTEPTPPPLYGEGLRSELSVIVNLLQNMSDRIPTEGTPMADEQPKPAPDKPDPKTREELEAKPRDIRKPPKRD